MATTVDTLLVRIESDMLSLRRDLQKIRQDTDRTTRGIVGSFRKMGPLIGAVAGAVVVRQIGRMGMAAINLASDVEEMQNKSRVVFGQFRDTVVADLTEFGDAVGRSGFELEEMASSIQDTFVPMGFARGEASKLSVELTKLAVDVASFNNASDVETMRAFQSAIVGNHETVRRFGIVITEATLKQELLRMGITKAAKDVTNAEKVQARMNLILAGTTDAQGDALATADSFANRVKKLKSEFDKLTLAIGRELMPVALGFVNFLIEATDNINGLLVALNLIEDTTTATEQLAKAREQLANLRTTDVNFLNTEGQLKREIALLEKQIKLRNANTIPEKPIELEVTAGDPHALSEDQEKLLKKNAVMREEIRLQRLLNKAKESGNKSQIRLAQRELDALPLRLSLTNLTEDLTDAEKAYTQFKTQSGDATAVLIDTNVEQSETLQQLKDDYDELGKTIENINPLQDELLSATQSLASGFSSALADMLMAGKFNLGSLMDIFKSFVRQMIAKAIELFFVNRILGNIFGLPTTTFASGATVLGTVATTRESASGGSAYGRQAMLVGERGPEIFVPHSAGTIMNSNNTRSAIGGRGGATVVQNINVTTGIQQTVRNEIRSLMPEIAANAKNAVMDTKRRGGNFGRAFA